MSEINLKVTKEGWKLELELDGETFVQESKMIDDNTASKPTINLEELFEDDYIDEELYNILQSVPMDIAMNLREFY